MKSDCGLRVEGHFGFRIANGGLNGARKAAEWGIDGIGQAIAQGPVALARPDAVELRQVFGEH